VSTFVIWTLDYLVLLQLFAALKTKTVTARQRKGFLVLVIVGLKTNATFKD
jgi:hypothetical protein